nr:collagen alpha-1(III) chain-like [Manis javanica]
MLARPPARSPPPRRAGSRGARTGRPGQAELPAGPSPKFDFSAKRSGPSETRLSGPRGAQRLHQGTAPAGRGGPGTPTIGRGTHLALVPRSAPRPLRRAAVHRSRTVCVFGLLDPHGGAARPGAGGLMRPRDRRWLPPPASAGQPGPSGSGAAARSGEGAEGTGGGSPDPARGERADRIWSLREAWSEVAPCAAGPRAGARLCGGLEAPAPPQYLRVCW